MLSAGSQLLGIGIVHLRRDTVDAAYQFDFIDGETENLSTLPVDKGSI